MSLNHFHLPCSTDILTPRALRVLQGEPGGALQVVHKVLEVDGAGGRRLVVLRLVGVVSLSPACGRCLPDVHSRVAAFVPWIERVVWPAERGRR